MKLSWTEAPQACWLCQHNSPSWVAERHTCEAMLLPTQDTNRKKLKWSIYSFGTQVAVVERSDIEFLAGAIERLCNQDMVAVRLAGDECTILFVHCPLRGKQYSASNEGEKSVTLDWNDL